jgi:hypothetical protein
VHTTMLPQCCLYSATTEILLQPNSLLPESNTNSSTSCSCRHTEEHCICTRSNSHYTNSPQGPLKLSLPAVEPAAAAPGARDVTGMGSNALLLLAGTALSCCRKSVTLCSKCGGGAGACCCCDCCWGAARVPAAEGGAPPRAEKTPCSSCAGKRSNITAMHHMVMHQRQVHR